MNWDPELEELARRRERALQLGGAEKVERHKSQGKLTVRERIDALLDAGTLPRDRRAHRPRDLRRRRHARRRHAGELRDGPRPHRRSSGRRRRRRLHRAGRRGRRVDLPEAGARRTHGARSAHPDRAPRRRLRRRRFGEVARDRTAFVRAVQSRAGNTSSRTSRPSRSCRAVSARSRASARRASSRATTA